MLEQPMFGRLLRDLRRERGLSQGALAGKALSTGYLSRLESGARKPTERVVALLAKRLNVDVSVFDTASGSVGVPLTQALSLATSTDSDGAIESLIAALEHARNEDPLLRWQALWLIAHRWRSVGERAKEQACFEELVLIADELGLPELRCRSRAELAQCLRSAGEAAHSVGIAARAYSLAKEAELSVTDTGRALQTLVSVEAEAGRLPDARAHVDELIALVEDDDAPKALSVEALWSAATVRSRQGDHASAREFLERAIQEMSAQANLTRWVRLRLAATSLYLQAEPPDVPRAHQYLEEAEKAVSLVSTPLLTQEMLLLQASLAFHEGRFGDARSAIDELGRSETLLTHRDKTRQLIIDSQLLIHEGHREKGLQQLKDLGNKARQASNLDLAEEIWRVLLQALETTQNTRKGR